MYKHVFKRPLDFFMSLWAIIFFSPIIIIVAILVRVKLGKPILFSQDRPGKDEKIFKMYKFRSMTNTTNENGELHSDKERLTKFGKFLRSSSLDELPGLFNILKGDMSIVGPRPLLIQYLPLYSKEQSKRHLVRPGLTGLAQINGRNAIDWNDKFIKDVEYINNISFIKDTFIILATVKKVLVREGISSNTSETMEYFLGNKGENL